VIRLALFGDGHLPDFAALARDAAVLRFTRFPADPPPDFAERWLATYEAARAEGTREAFAILDGEAFVGFAVAVGIDETAATVELGYAVVPEARGRGVAAEVLRQLGDWAFARGMQRLELHIGVENEASKRVAARCGYVREGLLRSVYFKEGLREDTELWSLLPSDRARNPP
jgi:RimJ/RimL family protein N-acetyltransferase